MRPLLALFAFVSTAAHAQHDDHADHHASARTEDAHIVVTINPEARVSVIIAAPMPPPLKCGDATELKVQIVNQGFVTAPLRASIVGDSKSRIALHMDTSKLSGRPEDLRLLHLIPLSPSATDITVAFSIDNNIGDLGGRDRVHLLVRCLGHEH